VRSLRKQRLYIPCPVHADADRFLELVARLPRAKIGGADLKLNLGSGTVVAPGWINCDLSPNALASSAPIAILNVLYRASGSRHLMSRDNYIARLKSSRFVFCDLTRGIPVADGAAAVVYSSHFFEHLRPGEARALLRESFRVLAAGGLLRITVPDVQYFAVEYAAGRLPRFISFLEGDHGYEGDRARHLSFWDRDALCEALVEAGFIDVAREEHQQGETPDLSVIETHTAVGALYVEARKPR
jgi:SAM-dependent methyltransferase